MKESSFDLRVKRTGTLHGCVLVAARQLSQVSCLSRSKHSKSKCFASFVGQSLDECQAAVDPRLVTAEHLSDFDLCKSIVDGLLRFWNQ